MKYKFLDNTNHFIDYILKTLLKDKKILVDMTCGNGHDSLRVLQNAPNYKKLYLYDVQIKAIENTKSLLDSYAYKNCIYLNKSHDDLSDIHEDIDFAIYNLGYLPGADKKLVTNSKSTIKSIELLLEKLSFGAIVVITTYPGHEEGSVEDIKIYDFLNSLDQKIFNVIKLEFINQKNKPCKTYILEKRSEDDGEKFNL